MSVLASFVTASPGPFRWSDDSDPIFETGLLVDANNDLVGVQATPQQGARFEANRRLVGAAATMHGLLVKACAAEATDNAQMLMEFFVEATNLLADLHKR